MANLPNDIREQLNLRLLEGETGRELVVWLNALPEVQTILGSQFNGSGISEVNLTSWRQGGYLQWLTERECFDSASALAERDCDLAMTGLSAERLLNMLVLRFGQLLMRWDFSPDENASESTVLNEIARKARILQGISRSVLAIHRIQSQSPRDKREPATSSDSSHAGLSVDGAPAPKLPTPSRRPAAVNTDSGQKADPALNALLKSALQASQSGAGRIPNILSGPITPSIVASKLPRGSKTDPTLSEILNAA